MKTLSKLILASALMMLGALVGAQTYPYSNPSYTPNADTPAVAVSAPSANADVIVLSGVGTVTLRASGTCTSLAATAQATNDGTNWTAVNLYPIATGTTAPTAVASFSAAGFWKINSTGFSAVRVNVSALTATCTFKLLGSPLPFNGTQF